jgi:hypothetical protein
MIIGEFIHAFDLCEEGMEEVRFSSGNSDEIAAITRILKPIINDYQRKKLRQTRI